MSVIKAGCAGHRVVYLHLLLYEGGLVFQSVGILSVWFTYCTCCGLCGFQGFAMQSFQARTAVSAGE